LPLAVSHRITDKSSAASDIQLYDVATLKEINPWEGHRGAVEYLAFSADGKRLLMPIPFVLMWTFDRLVVIEFHKFTDNWIADGPVILQHFVRPENLRGRLSFAKPNLTLFHSSCRYYAGPIEMVVRFRLAASRL